MATRSGLVLLARSFELSSKDLLGFRPIRVFPVGPHGYAPRKTGFSGNMCYLRARSSACVSGGYRLGPYAQQNLVTSASDTNLEYAWSELWPCPVVLFPLYSHHENYAMRRYGNFLYRTCRFRQRVWRLHRLRAAVER